MEKALPIKFFYAFRGAYVVSKHKFLLTAQPQNGVVGCAMIIVCTLSYSSVYSHLLGSTDLNKLGKILLIY